MTLSQLAIVRRRIREKLYWWFPENRSKKLEKSRRYFLKPEARRKAEERKKRYRNDQRYRWCKNAQRAARRAVSNGTIQKQPCEQCGALKVEAHHCDYHREKWLDVKWLCHTHHKQWHRLHKPVYPF